MTEAAVPAGEVDEMTDEAAAALLRPVCASEAWVTALVAGRPHRTLERLEQRSDAVLADLPWTDVEQALQAHPRIGDRPGGTDVESSWSRQEQSRAAGGGAGDDVARAVRLGNADYERRFGHVFLICATGLTSEEILAALRERLRNDPATERQVVRRELAAIARLRLARIVT